MWVNWQVVMWIYAWWLLYVDGYMCGSEVERWVEVYVYGNVSMCIGEDLCVCVGVYVDGWVSKSMGECLCVWVCVYVYG